MNEILQVAAPELSLADSRTWIGRILIGIVLGEAIWGFLTSITNNLALPAMARFMGGDAQSPLYLGKGDFHVAALFISFLELCFAGIVAVLLNSWSRRAGRVRSKSLRPAPVSAPPHAPLVAFPVNSPTSPTANTAMQANSTVTIVQPAEPSPQVTEQAKKKPPKKIYYNIVGEPVETDDE
jgi:hypothetical protein